MKKPKVPLLRFMLPLLVGATAFFAPIETKADDSCFSCGNYPSPSASISNSSYVSLSWGAFSSDCCDIYSPRYVVYRSTSSTFSWSSVTRLITTSNRYYNDYSATAGTTYWYWIGVLDDDGDAWVDKNKKDWGKRPGPSGLISPTPSCSISYSGYVYSSWSAVSGATGGYVIYRSTSSEFSWSSATRLGRTYNLYWYDYTATPGTTYYYWIGASDGNLIYVTYSHKDWGKRTGLISPTPSCSTSYSGYVYSSWSAVSGATGGYVIYRSTSSEFSWSSATRLGRTYNLYWYDYTATPGTTYYYWIGASDGNLIYVTTDHKDWGRRYSLLQKTPAAPTTPAAT